MANIVTIIGLEKIGLMKAGDDVARKIFESLEAEHLRLLDGDVVVVSQKIVSKAEGLEVDISTVKPSARARNISLRTKKDARLIELILKDSKKVLRRPTSFGCSNPKRHGMFECWCRQIKRERTLRSR